MKLYAFTPLFNELLVSPEMEFSFQVFIFLPEIVFAFSLEQGTEIQKYFPSPIKPNWIDTEIPTYLFQVVHTFV